MYDVLKAAWDVDFDGYIRPDHGRMIWGETGKPGYGLYDRALGAVYLNGGEYGGERIVSSEWVKQAGTKKISTDVNTAWSGGYGYQFWTIEGREGAFRADGAYGQLSIVLPDSNAVLATQCSEYNDQARFFEMLQKVCIYG